VKHLVKNLCEKSLINILHNFLNQFTRHPITNLKTYGISMTALSYAQFREQNLYRYTGRKDTLYNDEGR
jgi:hypothetical protein